MSSKKKKASGSEYEKKRKVRVLENKQSGERLRAFLEGGVRKQSACTSDDDPVIPTSAAPSKSGNSNIDESSIDNPASPIICQHSSAQIASTSYSVPGSEPSTSHEKQSSFQIPTRNEENFTTINFDEPSSWPTTNDKIRCTLIEHGIRSVDCILKEEDFSQSEKGGRKFEGTWFYKVLSNGEKSVRDWLIYGTESKSLFCFPCILFPTARNLAIQASLTDMSTGFSDWKHLNPQIPRHENSADHIENYVKWKRLVSGRNLIDSAFIAQIRSKKD